MIVLSRVEMAVVHLVLAACPYDWETQPHRITGLEIDALAMLSHVGDQKSATPNLDDDMVADLLVELLHIYAKHSKTRVLLQLRDAVCIRWAYFIIEPHCYEGLSRFSVRLFQFLDLRSSFRRQLHVKGAGTLLGIKQVSFVKAAQKETHLKTVLAEDTHIIRIGFNLDGMSWAFRVRSDVTKNRIHLLLDSPRALAQDPCFELGPILDELCIYTQALSAVPGTPRQSSYQVKMCAEEFVAFQAVERLLSNDVLATTWTLSAIQVAVVYERAVRFVLAIA
jgi:hypothetical protein